MKLYNIKGYAWIVVGLSSFLLIDKYIMNVSPSLIANELMSSFSINATQMSAMISLFLWSVVFCQFFVAGPIIDKLGFRKVSFFSLILSAVGLLLFVFAADIHSFLLGCIARLMIGIGASFATVGYIKAAAVWFDPRKFAFVCSFLMTAAMTGALLGQVPLVYLIELTGSWHGALISYACFSIVIALLYLALVRDYNPHASFSNQLRQKTSTLDGIKKVLLNKNNWYLTMYTGLTFTTIDVFGGIWGNNYFRGLYGINAKEASYIVSMMFLGLAIGSPIIGKLSEKFDNRVNIMIIFHIVATAALAIVLEFKLTPAISGTLLFVFGFCLGVYMLAFAIGNRINPIVVAATVAALINTGEPLLGALFDPLIGYFLDVTWSGQYLDMHNNIVNIATDGAHRYFSISAYHRAFLILVFSMVVSFFLLILVKDKEVK
ncbi:MFS transporter [Allofrancisella guangzhouensis]|uniref:Lysosomal dipeptide transporter MFSD1 n=1 Tax=Allofrancisella guangzhouensis TaxID=594679 RepID=A0A0A8E2R8_9GAMM|nr:MFS transporter [Allofrancisella guangzhouensis]AJC48293.1 MFS transporter [Allofrancisella guangzhouensis]MBK2026621.1 MFS transporter [Allofrancisella guangzhouensis]MBK2043804.1 MFS transporter [Allofrancisella guangzhouensis]MBK2045608.1 MFS transporter [Allofrancisella guangzhouensis]